MHKPVTCNRARDAERIRGERESLPRPGNEERAPVECTEARQRKRLRATGMPSHGNYSEEAIAQRTALRLLLRKHVAVVGPL
jgi:hypothetical protein